MSVEIGTCPMCLLAIFFRAVPDAKLVIGANREEFYDRGGTPPQVLAGPIAAIGGVDPVAGGTWFGVNSCGVVAAVTNRPLARVVEAPRSRGALTRELLGYSSAKEAVEIAVRELSTKRYAGCNLFCGDGERAVVIEGAEWLRVRPLPPGLHVLTNRDINDGSDPRVLHALGWLGQHSFDDAAACLEALKGLCSQSGTGGQPPMCLHGEKKGTVSSTLVALRQPPSRSVFLHAQGSPDRSAYEDYSGMLRELTG